MSDILSVFHTMSKTLSDNELREAISILCGERDVRGERKTNEYRYSLRAGDKVEWKGRLGACTGVVQKVKRKKAIVKEDVRLGNWDIPLSMLTKIN